MEAGKGLSFQKGKRPLTGEVARRTCDPGPRTPVCQAEVTVLREFFRDEGTSQKAGRESKPFPYSHLALQLTKVRGVVGRGGRLRRQCCWLRGACAHLPVLSARLRCGVQGDLLLWVTMTVRLLPCLFHRVSVTVTFTASCNHGQKRRLRTRRHQEVAEGIGKPAPNSAQTPCPPQAVPLHVTI